MLAARLTLLLVLRAACVLGISLGAAVLPVAASADPRAPKRVDRQLAKTVDRANHLLAHLELEEARDLLERAARDPSVGRASRAARSRLFVTLGRARAEIGDPVGRDEAFRRAIRLQASVELPARTSPKIRAALEHIRAEVGSEQAARPRRRAQRSQHPPPAGTSPTRTRAAGTPARPAARELPDARAPDEGRARAAESRGTSELEAEAREARRAVRSGGLPERTTREARRAVGSGGLPERPAREARRAVRSGGLPERPAEEPVPSARGGHKPAAAGEVRIRAPGEENPSPSSLEAPHSRAARPPRPPPLAEAWSEPPSPIRMPGLTESATTAVREGATPVGAAEEGPAWGPSLKDAEVWGLVVGALALTAGVVSMAVVLSSQGGECDAPCP